MDLLQVQEELNIIIQIMQQQLQLVEAVQSEWNAAGMEPTSVPRSRASSVANRQATAFGPLGIRPTRPIRHNRRDSLAHGADPMHRLLENLQREHDDLSELRDNANTLVNRTIQLVNIRLEDHGKAILVFTIVTLIFLPLSFVSSYFGMNTSDLRNMSATQSRFWTVSASITIGVVGFAIFFAFYGSAILERAQIWTSRYRGTHKKLPANIPVPRRGTELSTGFEIIGASTM